MKKVLYFSIVCTLLLISSCKQNPAESSPEPVTETKTGWETFVPPQISFNNEDANGQGKYFTLYISNPDSLELATCLKVCKLLYKKPEEVVKISRLVLTVRDMSGVAFTTGHGPATEKTTVFSSQYLKGLINNSQMSKKDVINEICGVITHETAHVFQSDNNYLVKESWSVIEGIADCVRYLAGDDKISRRHAGGSRLDGYTTTGFFIAWLQEKKDPEFLYKLNKYVGEHQTDFTWGAACWKLLDKSVNDLWNEYQAAI